MPLDLQRLASVVGPTNVLTDPSTTAGYVNDWTNYWHGNTLAVVRPGSTAEVAEVVKACAEAGVKVVPQGGNTGLVGGSIPLHGEVVLSTSRLNAILDVDPVNRTLGAQAGVTVARAHQAAADAGMFFPIELAARESATLGGIVATNAGGVRMVRHGNTRSNLLGIEAVLADGSVLRRWKSLRKDNIGYALPALFAGAEGTLGIVTAALFRLSLPSAHVTTALVGVESAAQALSIVDAVERTGLTIEAAEVFTDDGVALVRRHQDLPQPLDAPFPMYLLVEVSAASDSQPLLFAALEAQGADDAVVEPAPARRLWRYRESHTESIAADTTEPVVKLDVSAPLGRLDEFIRAVRSGLPQRFPGVRPITFGHVADGNIHVNVLDVPAQLRDPVTDYVFHLVADHDGSISAEHGIGTAKLPWLSLGRSETDLATMARIRKALDPQELLNPGVLRFER